MKTRLFAVSLFLVSTSAAAEAQESAQRSLSDRLAAWQARHGATWRVIEDPETGFARTLYGGRSNAPFAAHSDAQFLELAREAVRESFDLHGIEVGTLVDDGVVFLPLATAGSSDKLTAALRQEVNGVPVRRGFVNALFDQEGRLLSIESTALPAAASISTQPAVAAELAEERALALFSSDRGVPGSLVAPAQLAIDQVVIAGVRRGALAYEVSVLWEAPEIVAMGTTYRLDASTLAVLSREELVHELDVSGTVNAMLTPGLLPDTPWNTPTPAPVEHVKVSSAQGSAVTDSNGDFTLVGASAPVDVTIRFDGPFCVSNDSAQAPYSITTTLTTTADNKVLMSPAAAAYVTAEANAFHSISRLRDWTRAVNPADATADFKAIAFVNVAGICNAYFTGLNVRFFRAGGPCFNAAFSNIVMHEVGHWLNVKYNSNNGPDGFGEGNADVFAMYVVDDPVLGRDFAGWGTYTRTGLNQRPFCGDAFGGCYNEVHKDGEVLMGALWKVRARLQTSLGHSAGSGAADVLFNAWMNAFNDAQIRTDIRTHWLVLDDDDGNLQNGTPNYAAIDGAFVQQGFPSYGAVIPTLHCTAKTNSLGCVPALTFSGACVAGASSGWVITGSNVRNHKSGLLFYGITGKSSLPFQGGTLCVKSPLRRTPAVQSGGSAPPAQDCGGVFSIDMNAFAAGLLGGNPLPALNVPGTVVNCQWWGRDPGFVAPNNVTLTNALEYAVMQ